MGGGGGEGVGGGEGGGAGRSCLYLTLRQIQGCSDLYPPGPGEGVRERGREGGREGYKRKYGMNAILIS